MISQLDNIHLFIFLFFLIPLQNYIILLSHGIGRNYAYILSTTKPKHMHNSKLFHEIILEWLFIFLFNVDLTWRPFKTQILRFDTFFLECVHWLIVPAEPSNMYKPFVQMATTTTAKAKMSTDSNINAPIVKNVFAHL